MTRSYCQNGTVGWVLRDGEYHYRARYGGTFFGIWSVLICVMAGLPILDSAIHGGWNWLFGLWMLAIGTFAWLSIALEVSVAADGELDVPGLPLAATLERGLPAFHSPGEWNLRGV